MHRNSRDRMPDWLVGLVVAVVLAIAILVLANVLGAGDDPVVTTAR